MTDIQVFQAIVFFGSMGALDILLAFFAPYYLDKGLKKLYPSIIKTYKLKKSRFLFLFYNRKKGEIVNSVFWYSIAYYAISLMYLGFWVSFFILQLRVLVILLLCVLVLFLLLYLSLIPIGLYYYYKDKRICKFQSYYDQEQKNRAAKQATQLPTQNPKPSDLNQETIDNKLDP